MQDQDEKYFTSLAKKEVYLWNDQYECYVRWIPGEGYMAKFKGKAEYTIDSGSDIVVQAFLAGDQRTKSEYERY